VRAVAVVGAGDASTAEREAAEEVGRLLGERGCLVVTGGLGGVMAAASRGAASAGAVTVGLLPGLDRGEANEWVSVPIPTGLGELRNGLVVRAAEGLVAVGGGHGTLSEVALALKAGKPVVGLGFGYAVEGVAAAGGAAEAVGLLLV
jgi:uncharacterized protein (TIGR00725 family)